MNRLGKIALAVAALVAAPGSLRAVPVSLTPAEGSRLWLGGDSTLHRFEIAATKLDVRLTLERGRGESVVAAARAAKPAKLTVTVPVESMKSNKAGLNKNMRKAMKADRHPEIVFSLDRYSVSARGKTSVLVASGTLTIAGVSKPVALNAVLTEGDERLVVEGEQPLLMSDYGIEPPKMMLGAVKTDDKVLVKYRLELTSEPAAGKEK